MPKATCHEVFYRIEQAANYSKDLHQYLNVINENYVNRGHRPRRIEPGSEASKKARQVALEYDEQHPHNAINYHHSRQPLQDINPNQISWKQVKRVLQDNEHVDADQERPRKITRVARLYKTTLTPENIESRIKGAKSLISLAKRQRIIIVSCDETPHYFRGSKHITLTHLQGNNRYKHAGPKSRPAFTLQQWSACSSNTSILRRIKIWEPETDILKAELQEKLKKKQEIADEKVKYLQYMAIVEGLWEHRIMQETNYEIDAYVGQET